MENKSQDRRVRKTKALLLHGLTTLMREKSIKNISVRELSDLVDINRGTFYLHYKDVYDLLEKAEEEIINEFLELFSKLSFGTGFSYPFLISGEIFKFIDKYADFAHAILGKNGDIAFVEKFKALVREQIFKDWLKSNKKEKSKHFEYYFSFIASGFIGILQSWLDGGRKESPAEMAALAEQILTSGAAVLSK